MRRLGIGLTVLVLSCAAATPALAQQGAGEIRGRVLDEQGGALPGVTLVVTNQDTGVFREVVSNPDGSYFASQLYPGTYRVTAKLEGFKSFERQDLVLGVGRTLTLDVTLEVGALEDYITVRGESPLVDVTSAEVGGNVETAEIVQLPSLGRNFFSFVGLMPGIQVQATSGSFGCDTVVSSGGSARNNNIVMDGGNNMDDNLGSSCGAQTRVALESVQEFQVITNQFDAEFGRTGGSIINSITKQGTNQLRGSAFFFNTASAITAKNFFTKAANLDKPSSRKLEWGGTLGGPIVRDKAHFFLSLERVNADDGWAHYFPSRPDLSWSGNMDTEAWNTVIRVDHQINANNTWALRWVREDSPQYGIQTGADTPDTLRNQLDLDMTFVGNYTRVIGNSKVFTSRAGYTYEHNNNGNKAFHVLNGRETINLRPAYGGAGTDIRAAPPQLIHPSYTAQTDELYYGWIDKGYEINNVFSWFVANKGGDHDLKFGAQYYYVDLAYYYRNYGMGAFYFNTDRDFNAADPSTYPERLRVRVPGPELSNPRTHTGVLFSQDKWRVNDRLTVNAGLRYDFEIIPLDVKDNPLSPGSTDYPVDKGNVAPRLGFSYGLNSEGTSLLRGGYGIFYEKTYLALLQNTLSQGKYSTSFEAYFPATAADPGPSRGQFPTDPMLVNGPVVNWALLDQFYPPGAPVKNAGTVYFTSPDRKNAYNHQVTVGYERQLVTQLSVSADYIHTEGRNALVSVDLNPGLRPNTSRTTPAPRFDAFGVLGEPFRGPVYMLENRGRTRYDALNFMLEKRMGDFWAGRIAYTRSFARGNYPGSTAAATIPTQVGTELNLDLNQQPLANDRAHNLVISGRAMVPKTGGVTVSGVFRYLSGSPFTVYNSNIDSDRNGVLFDPLPAGTYSGTGVAAMTVENKGGYGGARGPSYVQLDMRFGYRIRAGGERTLDIFFELFNVTDRVNFQNPSGDMRFPATFLRPTALVGRSGFPRQGQFGVRFGF